MAACQAKVCKTVSGAASRQVKAGNKLHIASAPVNKSFGHFVAMILLEATYDCFLRNGTVNIQVFILGDNIPMLNALGKDSKEVNIGYSAVKTKALGSLLVTKYKGV